MHQSLQPADNKGTTFIGLMMMMFVLAPTPFLGLPEIIGQVARQHGFGESQLGMLSFAEIAGMTCGTLVVALLMGSQPVRRTLCISVLLAALGHVASALAPSFATMMPMRLLSGVGYGALSAISMRYVMHSDHPERNIGLMMMGQGLWSLVLLTWLLPAAGALGGATACYLVVAALMLPNLAALHWLGRGEPLMAPGSSSGGAAAPLLPTRHRPALITLCSLMLLYVGVGVMWTFVERVGADAGLSAGFIANTLGVANGASVVACWFAPRLTFGRRLYGSTLVMQALCGVTLAVLADDHSAVLYAGAVVVFLAAWAVAAVLLFSTVPRFDAVGRYAALAPGFLGLGFGIGSLLGGQLMEHASTGLALGVAATACFLAAALYASLPLRAAHALPQPAH